MMAYFFAGGKKVNYQEYKQLLNRELAKKVQREFDEFRKDIIMVSKIKTLNTTFLNESDIL